MPEDPNQHSPVPATQSTTGLYNAQAEQPQAQQLSDNPISWTASEYIAHEKSKSWFAALTVITLVTASVLYLITEDITVACLILVGGFTFGFYGARKPRQISYEINKTGLIIDERQFEFREFKSFSIVIEGAFSSILLLPHKRFAQFLSIYYPPEYETQVAKALGGHVPMEEHTPDFVERVTKRIRF